MPYSFSPTAYSIYKRNRRKSLTVSRRDAENSATAINNNYFSSSSSSGGGSTSTTTHIFCSRKHIYFPPFFLELPRCGPFTFAFLSVGIWVQSRG